MESPEKLHPGIAGWIWVSPEDSQLKFYFLFLLFVSKELLSVRM